MFGDGQISDGIDIIGLTKIIAISTDYYITRAGGLDAIGHTDIDAIAAATGATAASSGSQSRSKRSFTAKCIGILPSGPEPHANAF